MARWSSRDAPSHTPAPPLAATSPLSTTGAMCLAGISDPAQVRPTYNRLLAWGLSMTVIGAVGCYLFL